MDTRPIIRKAVELAGGQQKLADALTRIMGREHRPIRQQHVWRWINTVKVIDAEYALPIEQATEGQISHREIRPDIYPAELRA